MRGATARLADIYSQIHFPLYTRLGKVLQGRSLFMHPELQSIPSYPAEYHIHMSNLPIEIICLLLYIFGIGPYLSDKKRTGIIW